MPTATELGVDDVLSVVEQVFGLEGRARGDEYELLCPAHDESKVGSCSVNLDTGLWKCLACGTAGDLVLLGKYALHEDYEIVKRMLEPSSPEALISSVQRKLARITTHTPRKTPVKLPRYRVDTMPDEWYERGFTDESAHRWSVRYVVQDELQGKRGTTYTVHHSIALPIQDQHAQLLAWCYRRTQRTPSWQPKYLYSENTALSEVWFGLLHHSAVRHVAIVEGALDAIWLDQAGIPALALLGAEMGQRKLARLGDYQHVTLFPDYDMAGIRSVRRIGNIVGDRTVLDVVTYPRRIVEMHRRLAGSPNAKVDPQLLHPVDLELLIESAVPWSTWLRRSG